MSFVKINQTVNDSTLYKHLKKEKSKIKTLTE